MPLDRLDGARIRRKRQRVPVPEPDVLLVVQLSTENVLAALQRAAVQVLDVDEVEDRAFETHPFDGGKGGGRDRQDPIGSLPRYGPLRRRRIDLKTGVSPPLHLLRA